MVSQLKNAVVERILRSPAAAQIVQEIEGERLESRRKAAAEIEGIRAGLEAQLPALSAGLDKARGVLVEARAAVKAAEEAFLAAEGADRAARYAAEYAIGRLERGLRETASPQIDEFCAWVNAALEAQRRTPPTYETPATSLVGSTVLKPELVEANRKLRERFDGVLAMFAEARDLAEELRLSALTEAEVEARIASAKRAIIKAQVALHGGKA
jgi:hypothetical protein